MAWSEQLTKIRDQHSEVKHCAWHFSTALSLSDGWWLIDCGRWIYADIARVLLLEKKIARNFYDVHNCLDWCCNCFRLAFFCFSLRFYFTSLFPRRYPTYVFRTQNLEHFTTGFWFHYFASSISERHALRAFLSISSILHNKIRTAHSALELR